MIKVRDLDDGRIYTFNSYKEMAIEYAKCLNNEIIEDTEEM